MTVTTALEPCELETVMFPVTLSEAVGLNATCITALCPAPKARPFAIPLAVKSFALTVTCETVTLVFPLFVMVTFWELELPTLIPVKLRLAGLAESVTVAAVPVPLRATALGELGALLVMLTLPVRLPAVVGANKALNVAVPPAAIVVGSVRPLALKALPVTDNCEIVSGAVPVLLMVKLSDFVCPSTMLPKL